MADDKSSSGAWSGGLVVAGIAAVSALYVAFQHPPLVSNRPLEAEYQENRITAAQDIDARLWQDPFDAVARDRDADGAHSPPAGNAGLDGRDDDLAIIVTLSGAPYPEVAETRRRLRYAVLAAMHFRGFIPYDEKHIGYLRTDKPPFAPLTDDTDGSAIAAKNRSGVEQTAWVDGIEIMRAERAAAPLPKRVPFEQFEAVRKEAAEKSTPHVLLLWVDEDLLTSARTPIESLDRLRQGLMARGYSRFAVLGPQDSATLAAMAKEMEQDKTLCRNCFSIYNFGATAQDTAGPPYAIGFPKTPLSELFKDLKYSMTVTSDIELAETLACELMRRDPGIHLPDRQCENLPGKEDPTNHIVLVSDWDTVYGANLANTVKCVFENSKPQDGCHQSKSKEGPGKSTLSSVLVASYLRGLDGRLPNRRDAGQKVAAETADDAGQRPAEPDVQKQSTIATPENADQFERAEGQTQYDYLSRLATELKARDAKFRRDPKDGGHISAIGVLGSDVYDKLLILQALRPEFPDANFFTTDLDALLLPDKKSHYARNLIVVSSYGLQLDPSLDCGIPSFRNSYQTAIFVAAARALLKELPQPNFPPCKPELNAAIDGAPPQPWLFQIGRTRPQPLPIAPVAPARAAPFQTSSELRAANVDFVTLNTDINSGWLEPLLFQIDRTRPQLLPAAPVVALPAADSATWPPLQAADIGIVQISRGTRFAVFVIPLLLIGCLFIPQRVRHDCFAGISRVEKHKEYQRWWSGARASIVLLAVLALWARLIFGWGSAARWLTENGLGEPISVFEGVSIWPTIALRAIGLLLALFFIWYALHALELNRQETLNRFNEFQPSPRKQLWKYLINRQLREVWKDLIKRLYWTGAHIRGYLWFPRLPLSFSAISLREDDPRKPQKLGEILTESSSHWAMRCVRAAIATGLTFGFLYYILGSLSGPPPLIPARGHLAYLIYKVVSYTEFFLTLFLAFVVMDATYSSRVFIERLTAITTKWDPKIISKYLLRFELSDDLRGYIDLQYLAQRTVCIINLIYLPFLAWAIMAFSRSQLFDNFSMPWPLVTVYAAMLCALVGVVISYRMSAEKARRVACRQVWNRIVAAKGKGDDATAAQLEQLLVDMQDLREGAFAGWGSQPLVRAVLLPLLTYGGAWLAHLYALPGM